MSKTIFSPMSCNELPANLSMGQGSNSRSDPDESLVNSDSTRRAAKAFIDEWQNLKLWICEVGYFGQNTFFGYVNSLATW